MANMMLVAVTLLCVAGIVTAQDDNGCVTFSGDFKFKPYVLDVAGGQFSGLNSPASRALKIKLKGPQKSGDDAPTMLIEGESSGLRVILGGWHSSASSLAERVNGKEVEYHKPVKSPGVYVKNQQSTMWVQWTSTYIEFGLGDVLGEDVFLSQSLSKITLDDLKQIRFTQKFSAKMSWEVCQVGYGCPAPNTETIIDCPGATQDACESKGCLFCASTSQCYFKEPGCAAAKGDFKATPQIISVADNFPGLNAEGSRAFTFYMTGERATDDDAPTMWLMGESSSVRVILGGWGSRKSSVMELVGGKTPLYHKPINTPNVYVKNTFKPMWVQWTSTTIEFGFGEVVGENAFLTDTLTKVTLDDVQQIKFTQKKNSVVEWNLCQVIA